jgi:FtsP/CotA-like multicopper oxidase with cupredoxin domain
MLARRVGWLIAVVGVMAVLTAGWPLVSRAVSANQPSAAGQVLTIGPGGSDSAQFDPGPGWVINSAISDPLQAWRLARGPVNVTVLYVTLLNPSQAGRLWSGLGNILRLGDPSARLGRPVALAGAPAGAGQTGPVTENGHAGQVAVLPDAAADFAVEVVSAAPAGDSAAARATTALVVRSLRFPARAA